MFSGRANSCQVKDNQPFLFAISFRKSFRSYHCPERSQAGIGSEEERGRGGTWMRGRLEKSENREKKQPSAGAAAAAAAARRQKYNTRRNQKNKPQRKETTKKKGEQATEGVYKRRTGHRWTVRASGSACSRISLLLVDERQKKIDYRYTARIVSLGTASIFLCGCQGPQG